MKNFMNIVKQICNETSTDCRSLNKADLARELMNMVSIPQNAIIEEIPLDWDNQVSICFTIPNDENYYSLYAGHWNDGTESIMLCIIGTQVHTENKTFFDFFTEEKEISLDYFVKTKDKEETKTMTNKLKAAAEYLVTVKYIDYVKESIENGDGVETIVLHILDKENTTYAENWEMADHMDDYILAIAAEM